MIRDYRAEDSSALLDILHAPGGHVITNPAGVRQMLNENRVLVYDDQGIRGMACIETGKEITQVILYTAPVERGKGIGSTLWNAAMHVVEKIAPRTLWAFYRQDIGHAREFYAARGLNVWYAYHHMAYHGPECPEHRLSVKCYEDSLFDLYHPARAAAFADLDASLGEPLEDEERRNKRRAWANRNRDNIYLYFDGPTFVGGTAIFDERLIDNVFVAPEQQGKGYGALIVQDSINRILTYGNTPELAVVTTNTIAHHLYVRLGFEHLQTLELSRRQAP